MKKYKTTKIMIMGMTLWMLGSITPAMAYTSCVGGTEVTSNVYTDSNAPSECDANKCPTPAKTFCVSNKTMNWWSAFNWCKSNGGTLVSFSELCPGVHLNTNNQFGDCAAMLKTIAGRTLYTSNATTVLNAVAIQTNTGGIIGNGRNGGYHATCK